MSPQLICFSLFSIRYGYGPWIARFSGMYNGSEWVRVTLDLSFSQSLYSHHGQQFTSFTQRIFQKKIIYIYLYTYSWERCHIGRISDPKCVMSFACNIVCCYVSFLFRIYCMLFAMYVCMHAYILLLLLRHRRCRRLFFCMCVSLPIDLFDLLSKMLLCFFCVCASSYALETFRLWQRYCFGSVCSIPIFMHSNWERKQNRCLLSLMFVNLKFGREPTLMHL